ncbi:MAG TPA: ComF family protein [Erysipelothrix sp.]|nr:ComF family protein [Erysipelothrix sp.]
MSFLQQSYRRLHQSLKTAQPKCLWCLEPFEPYSRLIDCFSDERKVCQKCYNKLDYKPTTFKLNGIKVSSLYRYDTEFSKLLIQYKEQRDIVLAQVFKELIREVRLTKRTKILMPSSSEKLDYRGFNHLQEIFGTNSLDIFKKVSTHKQVGLNKQQRSQIKFELTKNIQGKVLLCDDVITTGSTLKQAISLLPHCDIECFVIGYKE